MMDNQFIQGLFKDNIFKALLRIIINSSGKEEDKCKSKLKYMASSKSYLLWPLAYFGGNFSFLSIGLTLSKTAGKILYSRTSEGKKPTNM